MIRKIIDAVISDVTFSGAMYFDRLAGIVEKLQKKQKDVNNGDIIKTFPVYKNSETCTGKEGYYLDLVPDSKKKSVCYFELISTDTDEVRHREVLYTSVVRLVFWCNLKRINEAYDYKSVEEIAANILKNIPRKITSFDNISTIRIYPGTYTQTPDIFTDYGYDEPEKQYLMYPFGYFAIDFEIKYRHVHSCSPVQSSDPACYELNS